MGAWVSGWVSEWVRETRRTSAAISLSLIEPFMFFVFCFGAVGAVAMKKNKKTAVSGAGQTHGMNDTQTIK